MSNPTFQIEGMTVAITHMDQMVRFYSKIFGIDFREKQMYGATLYEGRWGGFNLLFCPAEIARNTAEQNRHQLNVVVSNLKGLMERVKNLGGEVMGEVLEDEKSLSVGIYDPDKNSMTLKEYK